MCVCVYLVVFPSACACVWVCVCSGFPQSHVWGMCCLCRAGGGGAGRQQQSTKERLRQAGRQAGGRMLGGRTEAPHRLESGLPATTGGRFGSRPLPAPTWGLSSPICKVGHQHSPPCGSAPDVLSARSTVIMRQQCTRPKPPVSPYTLGSGVRRMPDAALRTARRPGTEARPGEQGLVWVGVQVGKRTAQTLGGRWGHSG